MNLAIWMALPLLAGSPPAAAPSAPPRAASVDQYTEMEASFDAELATWKQAVKDAEREERKELRANHPVGKFWPRFEAQAQGGEGRALLWMVDNVKNGPVERAERGAFAYSSFRSIATGHTGAAWLEQAVERIYRSGQLLTGDQKTELLGKLYGAADANDAARGGAGFWLASLLLEAEDEAQVERGRALMASLPKDFPGTQAAMRALAASITAADLMPGKLAPDFVASTIEGHEFKLSDYRGKVVLLDFYGFW